MPILENEASWRLGAYLAVLVTLLLAETWLPRRKQRLATGRGWHVVHNLALAAINVGVARLIPLLSVVAAAKWGESRGLGLFQQWEAPGWLQTILTLLAFDLLIYVQHVTMHRVPILWRLHMVHHADLEIDVSSGVRFHPVEILLSLALKCAVAILLGARPVDIVLFEILLNAFAMFNHSNLALPLGLDRWLRLIVVTPDMHRVHHSIERDETDTNYGFSVPWWDWLFRTYRSHPRGEQSTMPLGLPQLRSEEVTGRWWQMLWLPLK